MASLFYQPNTPYPCADLTLATGSHLHLVANLPMATDRLASLPEPLLQRLDWADALIVESDILTLSPELERLEPQAALAARLQPSDYTLLLHCCQSVNLPLSRIDTLPYWQVALMLQTYQALQQGLFTEYGVEYQLLTERQQQNRTILELEGQPLQHTLWSSLVAAGLPLLQTTLQQWHESQQALHQVETWWLSGAEPSPSLLQAFCYPLHQRVMTARHPQWVAFLKQLPAGNYLVAVGALHLFGPNALLAQLAVQ
ncbi:TraB/GumN family protein [unidentified bacterial endosymbiont]|uniref:TraB/GumN family protein n=1 Tax=unidentified bacterial endosymbiont TaxID=2355 RepID=UPI0020A06D82|nr:TraB/GumN family protein [unidentified bacterial endosymbiont]